MAFQQRMSVNVWFQSAMSTLPYCFQCAVEKVNNDIEMEIYADLPIDRDCPKHRRDNRERKCFGCGKHIRD